MDLAIIIPMHNAAATIARTLQSLTTIAQKHRVEICIIDDGSTDQSASLAASILADTDFLHHRILQQANVGSGGARNRGLDCTTAPWIYFLDADDELLADPVPLVDATSADTTLILAGGCMQYRNGRVKRMPPPRLYGDRAYRSLTAANKLPIGTLLFRRDHLTRRFDETLAYLEDWFFWLQNRRLFDHVARHGHVTLAAIHVHEHNKSSRFADIGRCRQRIAEGALAEARHPIERNNWRLQRAIGRMLQNDRPACRDFFALPCHPVLYAKFLAHACAGRWVRRVDPYAPTR